MPSCQNFNLTQRADRFERLILSAMLLHRKIGPTVQSTTYTNRLISSLSVAVAAIDNAFVSAHGLPSHNLIAIDPRFGRQITRRLGDSNAGARPTARDTLQLCHNEFP
jgi:hypothetical protein